MRFEAGRAAGAEEPGTALAIVGGFGRCLRCREVEQAADQGELGLAVHVGEKASGGGSREAIRQDMQQATADELAGGQGDDLGPLRVPVVAAAFSTPGPTALWSPGARLPPMMPAWPTRQWDAPRR